MAVATQEVWNTPSAINRIRAPERVGVVAGIAAVALVKYLDKYGIDGTLILRRAQLDLAALEDRYAYVSLQSMAKALELASAATADDQLALRFAESFEPAVSLACSYAMKNAPDLRTALKTLVDHRNTVADIPTQFTDCGAVSHFCWMFSEEFDAPQHITDYTMMRTLYHIQSATGKDWRPLAVHLTNETPVSDAEYKRIFGPNVSFNQPRNCFEIGTEVLDQKMPNADPDLYVVARNSFRRPFPIELDETSSVDTVHKFVGDRLERGGGTLKAAARHMGMTEHQLRGFLKRRGTCFQCLVDDTRKVVAEHYLLRTELRFSEITFRLGFSDQSVFTRAAKRWFGATPKQVRRGY